MKMMRPKRPKQYPVEEETTMWHRSPNLCTIWATVRDVVNHQSVRPFRLRNDNRNDIESHMREHKQQRTPRT